MHSIDFMFIREKAVMYLCIFINLLYHIALTNIFYCVLCTDSISSGCDHDGLRERE
jgi:hypothetical protein